MIDGVGRRLRYGGKGRDRRCLSRHPHDAV